MVQWHPTGNNPGAPNGHCDAVSGLCCAVNRVIIIAMTARPSDRPTASTAQPPDRPTAVSPRWKRLLVPIVVIVLCIPLFALAEASLDYIRTLIGESQNHFIWTFRRFLLPWAELAVLVPAVVLLAQRVRLGGLHPVRAGALHAAGSVAFGTTHLFLVVLVARELLGESIPLFSFTAGLISRYMLQDVFLYWTIVGGLQLFWHQRALKQQQLAQARLAADLAEARLAALESRLEPHFLFNTLNTAVMLVRGDQREQAVNVLLELSELLRTVIDGAPGHEVPLQEEWTFMRRYLTLQQARFQDRLTIQLECDPTLDPVAVPFLILQPLVENALRHGVDKRTAKGPGRIEVSARREDGRLRLDVRDNGPGPAANGGGTARPGLGLANVRARLRELYGDRGELLVGPASGGGTQATVLVPL